jgi:hypothetical protein
MEIHSSRRYPQIRERPELSVLVQERGNRVGAIQYGYRSDFPNDVHGVECGMFRTVTDKSQGLILELHRKEVRSQKVHHHVITIRRRPLRNEARVVDTRPYCELDRTGTFARFHCRRTRSRRVEEGFTGGLKGGAVVQYLLL